MDRIATSSLATLALATAVAQAAPPFFEGFEDPGWTQGGDNWNNNTSEIIRAGSGTNGITSKTGSGHAIVTNLGIGNDVFNVPTVGSGGVFTRFDGYSSTFGAGYVASLDVYLDTSWADGQGFDYTVASNGSDGNHQRDFMFHVGVVAGDLLVNASNNTDASFNASKILNENGGNNHAITSSGWYTFEQVFRDDAGVLAVDLNLRDAGGSLLYSITRSSVVDTIPTEVGGNRYGWFTYNNVDGLALDNSSLTAVPTPASAALLGLGGLVAVRRRR